MKTEQKLPIEAVLSCTVAALRNVRDEHPDWQYPSRFYLSFAKRFRGAFGSYFAKLLTARKHHHDLKEKLGDIASGWEKQAKDYRDSAALSGRVDGAHPAESTAYQQSCAHHAGVYQTCAHQLRAIIKKMP